MEKSSPDEDQVGTGEGDPRTTMLRLPSRAVANLLGVGSINSSEQGEQVPY